MGSFAFLLLSTDVALFGRKGGGGGGVPLLTSATKQCRHQKLVLKHSPVVGQED